MAVYIDNARNYFRGMYMSHMLADSTEELLKMAETIGVNSKWIQYPGTYREHFDVAAGKRLLALKAGAVSITQRELALKLRERQLKTEEQ